VCFGSRFIRGGGGVIGYPKIKLLLNRLANHFIRVLFSISLNDPTNAFKACRKKVFDGCLSLMAPHVNMSSEIPIKAIDRGYSWVTIPIT
jgi:dolichol-phosphate mannosyltransferase